MTSVDLLPDYGPLNILNLNQFLEDNKTNFQNIWTMRCNSQQTTESLDDYTINRYLNKGGFGKILLVCNKKSEQYFAMKCLQKTEVVKPKNFTLAKNEKYLLERLNFPFIVYLCSFIKDNSFLYFIIPFYAGRELSYHLLKKGKLTENVSRFVGAQLVLSLEYLHYLDIIYRDLKPENIMYDHTGYIKLIDFGFSKIVRTRTYTICGTQKYLAPEIVYNRGYGKSVDWWAFGVVLFEMSSGKTPFDDIAVNFFDKDRKGKFKMPPLFSSELKNLIENLLKIDLTQRLGNLKDGINDIKNHKWFQPILWMSLLNRKLEPPYIPQPIDVTEIETFNFTDHKIAKTCQFVKEFEDF